MPGATECMGGPWWEHLSLRPHGRILQPCFEHPVTLLCNKSPDIMEREAWQLVMGSETTEPVIPHQENKY